MAKKESVITVNPGWLTPRDIAFLNASQVSFDYSIPPVEYDDIVDTSHFRLSRDMKRDLVVSGNVGSGEQGLYDYQGDDKITKDNLVTDTELLLRSGKLDKADVQKLRDLADKSVSSDLEVKNAKAALDKAEQASHNRLAKVDEMLGVNESSSS